MLTVRAELACLSLSAARSEALLLKGPSSTERWLLRSKLAILKTSKNMSWPRLARPRDLVDSLVWRGDDRTTEIFTLELPFQADNQKHNKSGTVEGEGFRILR